MDDKGNQFIVFIVWLFICSFTFGYVLGYTNSTEDMTKQAIENKAGFYDPKTAEFKWREPNEK